MSVRDLAHIALRIAAVVIAVDILVSLPMAFTAARYYAPAVINLEILETTLPPYAVSLVGAILMYLFAGTIADRVVMRGRPDQPVAGPANIKALEQLAVVILGLYLAIMGLADIVHCLVRYVALKHAMSNLAYGASSIVAAPDTAKFGDALFRIAVGGFLIGNGDVFIRFKDRLRAKRGIAGEPGSST